MDRKINRRVCIKFCLILGKYATEILKMHLTIFVDESLKRTRVSECHSRCKVDPHSFEDVKRLKRPNTSKDENVGKLETSYEKIVV
ncbi:hypothetical protein TNCT_671471 [Trichonephila clavata]|uniref:Uncharacterized protein n=1 Tax=Trichonephila clavata TaxID=2740835 RepID=A0A8X6I7F0_TRICU|nr:hypothetical protein TNCT_671471 [Trichonephila clavata]